MAFLKPHIRIVNETDELTDYEKAHAMELFVETNGYIIALKDSYRIADANGWTVLANELDEKLDILEARSRKLLEVLTK